VAHGSRDDDKREIPFSFVQQAMGRLRRHRNALLGTEHDLFVRELQRGFTRKNEEELLRPFVIMLGLSPARRNPLLNYTEAG
jgi:hypothetical protein